MPHIFGEEVCAGIGSTIVSRGRLDSLPPRVVAINAGEAAWWRGRVIYQKNVVTSFIEADGVDVIDPKGANRLFAGDDVWAAWLDGAGYRDSLGRDGAAWGLGGVGRDGTVAVIRDRANGVGVHLLAKSGGVVDALSAAPDDQLVHVYDAHTAIWTENGRQTIRHIGGADNWQALTHLAFWLKVARVNGEWWMLYQEERDRVLFHPVGSNRGHIVTRGNAFGLNVDDNGTVVWAENAAESPDSIRVSRFADRRVEDLMSDVVIVTPPPPPPPPPSGGKVPEFVWDRLKVHNCAADVQNFVETGSVLHMSLNERDGMRTWFDKLSDPAWVNIFPNNIPDVETGKPVVFTTFICLPIGDEWHAFAMAMDYHNRPGEYSGGPVYSRWQQDIFYGANAADGWQSAKKYGMFFVHGARYGNASHTDYPNQLRERTNVQFGDVGGGDWFFAPVAHGGVGGGPVDPGGGGNTGGGETPGGGGGDIGNGGNSGGGTGGGVTVPPELLDAMLTAHVTELVSAINHEGDLTREAFVNAVNDLKNQIKTGIYVKLRP